MSERILLTPETLEEAVQKARDVLRRGGVVLYPTDTLYGLGADSMSEEALEKIYRIKGREEGKPIHSVFATLEEVEEYAHVTSLARSLAEAFLPGPLTLILAKKDTTPLFATAGKETFGVRVPKNDFCLALARAFGHPFTATSANKSGSLPEMSAENILLQLGEAAHYIDLIIDAGELPASLATTVVDVRGVSPVVLREGAIRATMLADLCATLES